MKLLNTFRSISAILIAIAILAPLSEARTRKGDKLYKDGTKAEAAQDYDNALTYYEQALEEDSRDPAYIIAVQRMRTKSADQHVAEGRKLLEQQKLNEALVQFQKALLKDPASPIALQMVRETNQMIKEKTTSPDGSPILTPAERSRRDIETRIRSLEGPPILRPINNRISSLKMNNQTSRVIYESVGKLAGINVLFDPAGIDTLGSPTRNFNLDLADVTLEEALNYVALVTHTFWKPISRNAIFVTQETEQKRQEYQDEVVKVFYIQNASTANEFNEIFNGVRTGSKLTTGMFQVASQNAIVARGTPDAMAIVETLVHELDRAKPEIQVDVMVLETSKSNVLNIGAALTGGNLLTVSPGTTTTSSSSTSGTTTTGSSINLSRLGKLSINNFSVALPGALAQALVSDSRTKILQNPQIRVTDGGKGSLKIGSKIPYVSGSLNSAVATPGSIPYATTQFQQIDVGVNVDITQPHVNGPDDISMHIKVEISNVTGTESIGGIDQPIISQRVNEADVRMKDGEYSLLGGLSQDSDTRSMPNGGLPGLSALPVLGAIFGTKKIDKERDDIVIALVPHIIRALPIDDQAPDGVLAGTERIVKVERKSPPAMTTPLPSSPGAQKPNGATPPLPPPGGGGDAKLAPTNNPRLPAQTEPNQNPAPVQAPAPVPVVENRVPRAGTPMVAQAAVPSAPPGTDVTPLQGMQQMGLAQDPVQGSAVADNADALQMQAPQNQGSGPSPTTEAPQAEQPATIQLDVQPQPEAQPEVAASAPEAPQAQRQSPVSVPAELLIVPSQIPEGVVPAPANSDNNGSAPGPQAKAVTRKPVARTTRVQLVKTPAPTPKAAQQQPSGATISAAPAQSTQPVQQPVQQQPVQLLEGHLSQQPDSSSTDSKSHQ